ncbi:MAG: hypothetical protein A4E25_00041 [Methanobacterium sp. PtaB.Bin024]|nr:MAG: hypothetical protein A4E25_00041 [Methanobacterium sp. PtaB.Bin024]
MGHKVGDKVTSAYFYPDQERLLKEYKKVMEYLTIYEKLKVIDNTDEVVKEQDKKIENLTADNEWMKEQLKVLMAQKMSKMREKK